MWDSYLIISGLDTKPYKYVTALLLHCMGKDALRVLNGMNLTAEEKGQPKAIIKVFDDHVLGETKEFSERFKFNKR